MNIDTVLADVERQWPTIVSDDRPANALISSTELVSTATLDEVARGVKQLNGLHPDFEASVHFATSDDEPTAYLEYRRRDPAAFIPDHIRR
jgi:hypothetical protein